MLKRPFLIILCLISLNTGSVFAEGENEDAATSEPLVTVTPPESYAARKILLFPLDAPSYAVRIATMPLGALLKVLEEKHAIEKTMDFLSNKEKTFWVYPIIEGGAGAGFGGGLGMRHTDLFHRGYLLAGTYRIHINMSQNASLSFGKPEAFSLFGRPVSYSGGFNWHRSLNSSYYGIGNNSRRDNHSEFGVGDTEAGWTFSYEPINNLAITPNISFSAGHTMDKQEGSYPNVDATFPPEEITAFGKWLDYIGGGIRLAYDTRENIESPEKGGLYALDFKRFQCVNREGFDYNQYGADLRQYIRLWRPRRLLVLHMNWTFKTPTGGGEIPFWRLSTLDADSPLRGFSSGRFRDRNSALFNIEYRYPVWSIVDGVLFYDTGRVFHSLSDLSLGGIKYSAGMGLNFRIPSLIFFHLHAAYGGEGINFIFGASKPL